VAFQLADAPSVLLLTRGVEEDATDCADRSQELELLLRELECPGPRVGDDESCELAGHTDRYDNQFAHVELSCGLGRERRTGHAPGERGLLRSHCPH